MSLDIAWANPGSIPPAATPLPPKHPLHAPSIGRAPDTRPRTKGAEMTSCEWESALLRLGNRGYAGVCLMTFRRLLQPAHGPAGWRRRSGTPIAYRGFDSWEIRDLRETCLTCPRVE